MVNFDSEFICLVFEGFRLPQNSRPKYTPKLVGIPLRFQFLEPKMFSRRFSAYGGDQCLAVLFCRPLLDSLRVEAVLKASNASKEMVFVKPQVLDKLFGKATPLSLEHSQFRELSGAICSA